MQVAEIINGIHNEVSTMKSVPKLFIKPNDDNWNDVLNGLRVTQNKVYKEPPICFEILDKDGSCRFGSIGNFSAVIGKTKSRKTFFVSLLLASSLKSAIIQDTIKFSTPIDRNNVVLFDTEQSPYDVSKVVQRVLKLAGLHEAENFETFGLRTLKPKERLLVIEHKIYNSPGLGVVVIDGIRDLISDINNPEEATMITSKLLKWTEELNIHIIVVLHQNKGDNNARGHLGSELVNKAETVVSVEKESDISSVKPEYMRGKDFHPFAFSVNESGLPCIINDWISGKSKPEGGTKKKLTAYDVPEETHKKILKEVFEKQKDPKYSELLTQIKLTLQSMGVDLGDNKVREYITFYLNKPWIIKVDEAGKYAYYKLC